MSPGSGAGERGCHRTGKGSQVATTMGNSKESSGAKREVDWKGLPGSVWEDFSDVQKRRKVAPAPEESATSLNSSLGREI